MTFSQPGSAYLKDHYDTAYFLTDCGGYHDFVRHRGRVITDARLGALADLLLHRHPRRVLDLGCGRGELTFQAARQGAEVVAVDYSAAALELAESCFGDNPELRQRVVFHRTAVSELALDGRFDAVVAADLVEHLSPPEVEALFDLVARHLAPGGFFVVHTFPNRWYYDYDYPRQRRAAAARGIDLPADPRSDYEKQMHINEQRPQILRRGLSRFFPHLLFWFAAPEDPAGSLVRPFSRREMASARDLFAVAARRPLSPAPIAAILAPTPPLPPDEAAAVDLNATGPPPALIKAGERFWLVVRIHNRSRFQLSGRGAHPVLLSYHWCDAAGGYAVFDGLRTSPGLIPPGAAAAVHMLTEAPPRPGRYRLQPRLVQEGVRWHEGQGWTARADCEIEVVA